MNTSSRLPFLAITRGIVALGIVLSCCLFVLPAHAVQQPDGTTIPVSGSGLELLFASRGESLDAQADAMVAPETFSLVGMVRFELVQRDSFFQNSFGWYNATGTKPDPSELYELIACTDAVSTLVQHDFSTDPNYLGGEIGFYQAVGSCGSVADNDFIVYSEPAYDPDASQLDPNIHLLRYESRLEAHTTYFAWEDLLQGGDNDFSDTVVLAIGVTCPGGGDACSAAAMGVCGDGVQVCQDAQLVCFQGAAPEAESCNGLDDDCDGETDEGDLCPDGELCQAGECVVDEPGEPDAGGNPMMDAGSNPMMDAGGVADAGSDPMDAGASNGFDSGSAPLMDVGVDAEDGKSSSREEGGCASQPGAASSFAPFALLLLGLVFRRRYVR